MATDILRREVFFSDVVASETLRSLIHDGHKITDDQIAEILRWSGDNEYVTVSDIREG